MATLTNEEVDAIRQPFAREAGNVAWRRQILNAAAQAVEDVFVSAAFQNAMSSAIDTAIAPATMTAPQKKAFVKWFLKSKFDRGN